MSASYFPSHPSPADLVRRGTNVRAVEQRCGGVEEERSGVCEIVQWLMIYELIYI